MAYFDVTCSLLAKRRSAKGNICLTETRVEVSTYNYTIRAIFYIFGQVDEVVLTVWSRTLSFARRSYAPEQDTIEGRVTCEYFFALFPTQDKVSLTMPARPSIHLWISNKHLDKIRWALP